MIGYRELKELTSGGIVGDVAALIENGLGDQADALIRRWWAERGVDYDEIQKWANEQSTEDIGVALAQFGQVIPGDWMGAMLATAYELGSWAGFRLATEATVKA